MYSYGKAAKSEREKAVKPQNVDREKAGAPRGKPQRGKAGRGKPIFNASF